MPIFEWVEDLRDSLSLMAALICYIEGQRSLITEISLPDFLITGSLSLSYIYT